MSTGTMELEFLEGIDLEGAPPCEMKNGAASAPKCGKPSVARITIYCCGFRTFHFICQRHLDRIKDGVRFFCTACGEDVTDWRIT